MNEFDKYFNTEYIPTYAPLPIGAIEKGLNRRQERSDTNLASIDQLDDLFNTLKFLPQDEQRATDRLDSYRNQLNNFSQNGDYSETQPFIRRVARKYAEDINSGYLGNTQQSYKNYTQDIINIDKSDRPNREKELSKQLRFKQYQGVTPDGDNMFGEVYQNKPIPEYIDIMKEGASYLKSMKPQEIATTSGWFQTPDGQRWLKNDQKTESLPAKVLYEAALNVLSNNPKAMESIGFSAQVSGQDPEDFAKSILHNTASTLSNLYKQNNVTIKQSQSFTPEWHFNLGNQKKFTENVEELPYEKSQYFKDFDIMLELNSGNETVLLPSGVDHPLKEAVLTGSSGYGPDAKAIWNVPKTREGNVQIPDAFKETYSNISKIVGGDTDIEIFNNVKEYINRVKEGGISTKYNAFIPKIADSETKYLKDNYQSRYFYDPESGELILGRDLVTNSDILKSVKELKGKSAKEIIGKIRAIGKASPDNLYMDITNNAAFANPYVVQVGNKILIASQPSSQILSEQGIKSVVINLATRSNRSTIPIDIGKAMQDIKGYATYGKQLEGTIVQSNSNGTYSVYNENTGKRLNEVSSEELMNTIAIISE